MALITLVVLAFASLASGSPKKDKNQDEEATHVYSHTYDEVFQGALETIERMGMFATDKDKDKGKIGGNGNYRGKTWQGVPRDLPVTFDIQIETVNAKPETQVVVKAKATGWKAKGYGQEFANEFSGELQKVLATYR
jgi:hypothetical protein